MCNSEGETKENSTKKSKGFYLAQLLIIAATLAAQIFMLTQIPLYTKNKSPVILYLVSNLSIVAGYLLDLVAQYDSTIRDNLLPQKKILAYIILIEVLSIIFDFLMILIFGIISNETIHLPSCLVVPILSLVGIGAYTILVVIYFLDSYNLLKKNRE